MVFFKVLAFLCVCAGCLVTAAFVANRKCSDEDERAMDRIVKIALVAICMLLFTSIPLAFYTLCAQ